MANVIFSKKALEQHFKLADEMLDKIAMFGTPISIKADSVEVEVFPNRPDLLSLQGFVRAIEGFTGKQTGLKNYSIKKPEKDFKVIVSSSVEQVRPYTACAIVKNLKFDDEKIKEVIDVQEKLHITIGRNRKKVAIGIYPLEKIKLPIKYEARKPEDIIFKPLEGEREMSAVEILRSHPTGREYAHLLEKYDKYPIFVDAKNHILSMPPIINSEETGKITTQTRDIFIECSGHSLDAVQTVLAIIVTMFSDMKGTVYAMNVMYKNKLTTPNLSPRTINLSLTNANKLIGFSIKESEAEKLLGKMGMEYKKGIVKVPAWRADVMHEVDIIEDLAIAYGYDKLIPEFSAAYTTGMQTREKLLENKIAEILVGLGLLETSSLHLIKQSEAETFNITDKLEVESSKTEYKILRPELKVPMLRILSENKDNEYPQKIFEIGKTFKKDEKGETGIAETNNLAIALCSGNATEMKQVLDYLFNKLGLEYSLADEHHKHMIPGRSAAIKLGKKTIGYFGEIHPETLLAANIKMPVVFAELSLKEIQETL